VPADVLVESPSEQEQTMSYVTSRDGTSIAYRRGGSWPAVILVSGGLDDGAETVPLAAELAAGFTVYTYARRGRGDSGDTLPYAVEREIEDVEALIADAGGPVHLAGFSSGGGLTLRAAAAGLPIEKVVVYDVPYCLDPEVQQRAMRFVDDLGPALADGRRDDALVLFMRFAGSSQDDIDGARGSEFWPGLLAIAHTLAYDAACMGDYRPPADLFAAVKQPTLVLTGGTDANAQHGMGGMPPDFFVLAGDAIAAGIPGAQRQTVPGQHVPDPAVLGPVLTRFFTG
jgi:pimeloyl-ACP methyl ester carboxylesterase